MPLPLVFKIAAAALPVVASVAAVVQKAVSKQVGHRVAILGRQRVGKSTLLNFLAGDGARNETTGGRTFELSVAGKRTKFFVDEDLPGNAGLGQAKWKSAFNRSEHVWYLFRADLIARGDQAEILAVKSDLSMLKAWMKTGATPRITLIGTWADMDPNFTRSGAEFSQGLLGAPPIKTGAVKLNNANLVVGGLADDEQAKKLTYRLRKSL